MPHYVRHDNMGWAIIRGFATGETPTVSPKTIPVIPSEAKRNEESHHISIIHLRYFLNKISV